MLQAHHIRIRAIWLSLFLCVSASLTQPAAAQNRDGVLNRIRAIEAQLETLHGMPASSHVNISGGQAQIALGALQEDVRKLRGDIEQMNHAQRRQQEILQQLGREMDLRCGALEKTHATAATTPEDEPKNHSETASEAPLISAPAPAEAKPEETPGEDYKKAFETLNKGNYASAETQFTHFIERFPEHSLIGNAYYWLGETHYVQEQFDAATNAFRQGFQTMPQGPKAPDNLLRLGMTLGTLERDKEACIILQQLMSKYAGQSKSVERKASHEREKLGCK